MADPILVRDLVREAFGQFYDQYEEWVQRETLEDIIRFVLQELEDRGQVAP